ncbi:zinc finger B-box domain-containing protein 1 isoform X1 [Sciurus carolinensis]|uniref:zinc finger B-box domain-containing protein 1 isoform X1 n=1 Tax=Sciurus carolinensis TaxID=30640 RepID=UPI001FB2F15E|nr:zinc finger B-box domain-containing protein 1 isoform X1 [Sciurus carolinensis]XP_047420426.1 zinc finger B-box domain-containing protein 1 isoform X1 [Sciurus carolinensis]
MNTKDFVVIPWGKPGNSVKLKYKNIQELRMEKVQLELENQEMEKKLQEFQSTRSKEKEEGKSSGYHWKSGKVGKLGYQSYMMSQNKGNAIKLSSGKVKLKLLKQQIQEPVKQPAKYRMEDSSRSEKPKIKGKICGQCENKSALLVCLECGEDYCSGCFAKIHQKGALKLHRTTLLQAKSQILSSVLDVAHRFIKEVNPDECIGGNNSIKDTSKSHQKSKSLVLQGSNSEVGTTTKRAECTNSRDRLLCEGTSFDEEASAQSFQEVLNQWRTGNPDDNKKQNLHAAKPDSLEECEVQTTLKIWREPLNIEFKEDSLSYMEKLWLKKHRRTPQDQQSTLPDTFLHPRGTSSEAECSQNENDEDSNVEENKVQQPTFFRPVEEEDTERSEPSLTIIELDNNYEEEHEEPGDIVPYRVELADSDSQPSCTLHDYQQNSFPYENDIYQNHVFNKEKTDLLNLCLKNNSTYCEDNLKGTSNIDFDNVMDPDDYYFNTEKTGESNSFKRHFKEKQIDTESNQKFDDSCISLERRDSLPNIHLDKSSVEEKLSQHTKKSLDSSNLHERPNFEDSKTTESPLSLQEIALRSKPITEPYQGLERFFTFDKNEKLNLIPSYSLECNHSSTRSTLAGDREWIPESSLNVHADNAVAFGLLQSFQTLSSSVNKQKMGQKSQRPSTANLPLSNSVKNSSNCLSSSHPRSRSATVRSLSRAASEILEIEYIDITDQNEPFLDNTADQQTLESLEKELNVLRNHEDPSEKLYNLTSEELPAFNIHSLSVSQTSTESLVKSSPMRYPCGVEELSSYGKDTEMQSLLSLSESSTDEEEDFLDKQHVITLPWSK